MTTGTAILLAASALEASFLVLLVSQRVYRTLPAFFSYQVWCLCSGIAAAALIFYFPSDYRWFYLLNITGDALFELSVLAELGRVVLRHNRVESPARPLVFLLLMVAVILVWSLARWTSPEHLSLTLLFSVRMRQVFSVLQFASLLTLVWLSTLRSLRWPIRALQVATGLGFYFLIDLAVTIMHTHQSFGRQFVSLDHVQTLSYFGVLAYWVFCFARSQTDRWEFSQ